MTIALFVCGASSAAAAGVSPDSLDAGAAAPQASAITMQRTQPVPAPDYMVIGSETREISGDDSVVQPDGKMVVLTTVSTGSDSATFAFIRYNADGTRDKAFGEGGTREVQVGSSAKATNVELMTDGRIVGFGASQTGNWFYGSFGAAAVRLNPDGSVDTSYGTSGVAFAGFAGESTVSRGALAPDGSAYIAGAQVVGSVRSWSITRFAPNGALDEAFGDDGHVIGAVRGIGHDIHVLSDGKLMLVGCRSTNRHCLDTASEAVVGRFLPTGAPDPSFGGSGLVTTALPGFTTLSADEFEVGRDNSAVVLGSATRGGTVCSTLVRVRTNGTLEPSFGSSGWVASCSVQNAPVTLTTNPDGSILAVGVATSQVGARETVGDISFGAVTANDKASMWKVSAAGIPDPAFGGVARQPDGLVVHGFGEGGGAASSVEQLPDGKLLLVGSSLVSGARRLALARFNADGTPDTTFGSGARNTETAGGGPEGGCIADGVRTLGSAKVHGCFTTKGSKLIATGTVDVHGIKLVPDKGSAIQFDTKTLTLSTTKGVEIYFGDVNITRVKIRSWRYTHKLPEHCWQVRKGATFKGLPIQGEACVKLRPDGSASAQAWALVPKLSKLSNVTAAMNMSLSLGEGLQLDSIKASMEAADLPSVGRFSDLHLSYALEVKGAEITHTWKGGANLMMPQPLGGAGGVEATVVNSELRHLGATARFDVNRPIGTTGVFMNWVQVNLAIGQGISIGGTVGMSFGPKIGGAALAQGELSILFETQGRCTAYAGSDRAPTVTMSGTADLMKLVKLDGKVCGMALGFASVDGTATLGRTITIKAWKVEGKLKAEVVGHTEGWLEPKGNFSIGGNTRATLKASAGPFDKDWSLTGVETLMTSRGATACWWKDPKKFGVGFGLGDITIPNGLYAKWDSGKLRTGCGLKKIKVTQLASASARARSGARMSVVGGASFVAPGAGGDLAVQLDGDGAPPSVTLTAPGGQQYSSDGSLGDEKSGVTFATIEGQTTLDVIVPDAKRGTWKLVANAGSPAVTAVDAGVSVSPPQIRAKVRRGTQGRYELSWKTSGVPLGASIRFVDRVGGVTRTIVTTTKRSGSRSFSTVAGTSTRHSVYAVVTTADGPLSRPLVTSFRASKLGKPGAATKVKVKRAGAKITLAWRAGKGGTVRQWRYVARISSGRVTSGSVRGGKLVLRGIRGRDKVKLTLVAVNAAGVAGRPVTVKIS